MDGYPISYATAVQVFYMTPEPPKKLEKTPSQLEDEMIQSHKDALNEEEEEVVLKPQFQKHIYPDCPILIRGDDYILWER